MFTAGIEYVGYGALCGGNSARDGCIGGGGGCDATNRCPPNGGGGGGIDIGATDWYGAPFVRLYEKVCGGGKLCRFWILSSVSRGGSGGEGAVSRLCARDPLLPLL